MLFSMLLGILLTNKKEYKTWFYTVKDCVPYIFIIEAIDQFSEKTFSLEIHVFELFRAYSPFPKSCFEFNSLPSYLLKTFSSEQDFGCYSFCFSGNDYIQESHSRTIEIKSKKVNFLLTINFKNEKMESLSILERKVVLAAELQSAQNREVFLVLLDKLASKPKYKVEFDIDFSNKNIGEISFMWEKVHKGADTAILEKIPVRITRKKQIFVNLKKEILAQKTAFPIICSKIKSEQIIVQIIVKMENHKIQIIKVLNNRNNVEETFPISLSFDETKESRRTVKMEPIKEEAEPKLEIKDKEEIELSKTIETKVKSEGIQDVELIPKEKQNIVNETFNSKISQEECTLENKTISITEPKKEINENCNGNKKLIFFITVVFVFILLMVVYFFVKVVKF